MADTKLTQTQVIAAIKAERDKAAGFSIPTMGIQANATDAQIAADAAAIRSQSELDAFIKTGYLPTHGFAAGALAAVDGKPRGQSVNPVLGGAAFGGPLKAGARAAAEFTAAKFARKAVPATVKEIATQIAKINPAWTEEQVTAFATEQAAAEAAGAASKTGRIAAAAKWSRNHKIAATAIAGGTLAVGSKLAGSAQPKPALDATNPGQADALNALATANANGVDVNSILKNPLFAGLKLNANNLATTMGAAGYDTTGGFVGLNGVGIHTGESKTVSGGMYVGSQFQPAKNEPEVVSLAEWNKRFPADAAGLAALRKKYESAGLSFSADPMKAFAELKSSWNASGQTALDYSRAGHNMTPWDILNMQKSFSGGGGSQTQTTVDTSQMTETDIKALAKRQLAVSLGLNDIDDKTFQSVLKTIRANEKKKPTTTTSTTIGNKTTRNTVQGYGQADVLKDVEAYAKTDPRYSDFQTADVFGTALNKALGLRA